MDNADTLARTKFVMATNQPCIIASGPSGPQERNPSPNEQACLEIPEIHSAPVNKGGDIDYEIIVKVPFDGFGVCQVLMRI